MKLILLFAIPIFFGNLFQILYSLIDTKIVGSILGENALAAVGSVSTLYNLLAGFVNGLTMGFSVLTARYYGSREEKNLKKNVANTISLGLLITLLLVVGTLAGLNPILQLLNVPMEQYAMAYEYVGILVLGMFVTLGYNICANTLRAIGDSLTPLIYLIIAAVLNVGLDYLLF